MRVVVYFIVAIGLIWIGVLESGASSVNDFKHHASEKNLDKQSSIRRLLSVGFVGDLVVKKKISDGRGTIISKGNEHFLAPGEVSTDHVDN